MMATTVPISGIVLKVGQYYSSWLFSTYTNLRFIILISVHLEVECPHIMISYQWDSQPVMLKVKDRLKHAGYKVWMDVEHMSKDSVYL